MSRVTDKTKEWTEADRELIRNGRYKQPEALYPDLKLPLLSVEAAMQIIIEKCGPVNIHIVGRGSHTLIILPEAYDELIHSVNYGRLSPMNIDEQKFIGLGHFLTAERGSYMAVVSHFIQIHTMNRSGGAASCLPEGDQVNPGLEYLTYYREKYIRNEAACNKDTRGFAIDPFLRGLGSSEYILEGHTHPDIGAFFSIPDEKLGRARASKKPVVSFVCDPIRCEMKACTGKNFEETTICICERAPAVQKTAADSPETRRGWLQRVFFKMLGVESWEDDDGWYSV